MRFAHLAHNVLGLRLHSPGCPEDARRLVVDHLSLQPWCLDAERVEKCDFYVETGG
jgi:hypothetical protein